MTRTLSLLAIALTAIAVACTSKAPAAIPTPTDTATVTATTSSTTPGASSTPPTTTGTTAGSTNPTGTTTSSTPVSTPPPAPTQIPTPRSTPTPAIKGEPISSTATLARSELPPVQFLHSGAVIASLPIEVLPPDQFEIGFSGRTSIGDERGMLFWYPKMARGSFWMKNTHFDLAIAFVASDEGIVDIVEMQRESTSIITPKGDYQYAIEAPAGWYLSHGVRIGDRAHLAFPLPKYLTDQ